MTLPWLTILALLPALGALVLIFSGVKAAKHVALAVSLITFAFAVVIATQFKIGGGMQLVEQVPWIKPLGVYYALGLDGIGLTLVLLVVIITPVVIIASWRDFEPATESVEKSSAAADKAAASAGTLAPKYDSRVFFALVLAVQSCALYLFLATDVFLF
jgi:NADH-quinone oxidoreductase subunit M